MKKVYTASFKAQLVLELLRETKTTSEFAAELQIGSGTIESSCNQLVSARLKQAGKLWSEAGASAVVAV
jgi:hypothetical protein